jgi:hypothetical protein
MWSGGANDGVRPREQRISVVIHSRMRVANRWSDVCIRNISSRGLLIAASDPPPTGSYVEIRRGTQIIVARAVWSDGRHAGLRAQEKLPVQRIISEPRLTSKPAVAAIDGTDADRRRAPRLNDISERTERSRRFASAFQFGLIAAVGLGVSAWAATSVYGVLSSPLQSVERALSSQ